MIEKIYISAHFIKRIRQRFFLKHPKEIVDFLKYCFSAVKVLEDNHAVIVLYNVEKEVFFKGQQIGEKLFLETAIPESQFSNYQIRKEWYDNLKEKNLSSLPLMFANHNLYEENIIRDYYD